MTEYMDIVDDEDVVVGRDTRERVHDQYLIHRGVHVVVVDDGGRVLVQRRSLAKDYYPGYLDASVGAQVASGETYEQAGGRELLEELGCHDGPLVFVGKYDAYSSRQREKRTVFLHRCNGPFMPQPEEVESVAFCSVGEIRQMLDGGEAFTEGFRRSFAIYLDWLTQSEAR